jgi:thiol-disulfide isomerase/thioredoxin
LHLKSYFFAVFIRCICMKLRKFIKKNWSNVLIIAIIGLLFIPQTGMPIKVFISRLISFSPSEISAEKRETLDTYDWQLETLAGERVNLTSSEGKVILINFWATWCAPCVAEMPSLQDLYSEYQDKMDFYFVSMESPNRVRAFMEKKGYDFPVYIPMQQVPYAIESYSLPTTYVISKDGKIAVDKTGAANWNSESTKRLLDDLLKE